jgi:hypothetical protein
MTLFLAQQSCRSFEAVWQLLLEPRLRYTVKAKLHERVNISNKGLKLARGNC